MDAKFSSISAIMKGKQIKEELLKLKLNFVRYISTLV